MRRNLKAKSHVKSLCLINSSRLDNSGPPLACYGTSASRDQNMHDVTGAAAAASQLPVQHGRLVSNGATDGRPHLVRSFLAVGARPVDSQGLLT